MRLDQGKGDVRRPKAITRDEYYNNHERTFGKPREEKRDDPSTRSDSDQGNVGHLEPNTPDTSTDSRPEGTEGATD